MVLKITKNMILNQKNAYENNLTLFNLFINVCGMSLIKTLFIILFSSFKM